MESTAPEQACLHATSTGKKDSLPSQKGRGLFKVYISLFPLPPLREGKNTSVTKAHLLKGEVNYCYIINLTRKLLKLMKQSLVRSAP